MRYGWIVLIFILSCDRYGDRPLPKLTRGFQTGIPTVVEGVLRYFDIYVPEDVYNGPAVILLGDYGESASSLAYMAPQPHPFHAWKEIADREKVVLVYPNSFLDGRGYANWNDCRDDNGAYDIFDNLFLFRLMNEVRGLYLINLNQVYLCGSGNGGMMALRGIREIGFTAAIAVSGAGEGSSSSCIDIEVPTHVLFVHGDADTYIPYAGGPVNGTGYPVKSTRDMEAFWQTRNGCAPVAEVALPDLDPTDGCTVWQQDYLSCSTGKQVRFLRIANGGHAIPSRQYLHQSHLIPLGNQCRDIEFAEVAWAFFKGKSFR